METPESFPLEWELDPLSTAEVNLTRPLPAPFRGWATADLTEMEIDYLIQIADARAAGDAASVAYLEHQLAQLDVERHRQRRLIETETAQRGRSAPLSRPDGRSLGGLAAQLKQEVNLIEFVKTTGIAIIVSCGDTSARAHCPNPLHPDANPSCAVYERRYRCFGCGSEGDIYHLLNLARGITSFRDRVQIVAEFVRRGTSS